MHRPALSAAVNVPGQPPVQVVILKWVSTMSLPRGCMVGSEVMLADPNPPWLEMRKSVTHTSPSASPKMPSPSPGTPSDSLLFPLATTPVSLPPCCLTRLSSLSPCSQVQVTLDFICMSKWPLAIKSPHRAQTQKHGHNPKPHTHITHKRQARQE